MVADVASVRAAFTCSISAGVAQVECVIDLRRVSKQQSKVRHLPMRYSCIHIVQCGFVILNAESIPYFASLHV